MAPNASDAAGTPRKPTGELHDGRREFLKKVGIVPAALMAAELPPVHRPNRSQRRRSRPTCRRSDSAGTPSRGLICGANPFNAGSHLSVFVNHEMRSLLHARADPQDAAPLPGGGHQLLAVGRRQLRPLPPLRRRGRQDALPGHRVGQVAVDRRSWPRAAASASPITARSTDRLFKHGKLDKIARLPQAGPRRRACWPASPPTCPPWSTPSSRRAGTSTTT